MDENKELDAESFTDNVHSISDVLDVFQVLILNSDSVDPEITEFSLNILDNLNRRHTVLPRVFVQEWS